MKTPFLHFSRGSHDRLVLAGLLTALAATAPVQAQSGTWNNPATGGLWSVAGNWTGGVIADGSGSTADFSTLDLTSDHTVVLDGTRTLTGLTFGDLDPATPANWMITDNADPLNFFTLDTTPTITVNALGSDATATVRAAITGSLGLIKAGAGPLTLAGFNTYGGTTNVSGGILRLGTGGVINAGALSTANVAGARYIGSGGDLTSSALSTINQTGGGFLLESGSATFNGGIRTANSDGSVIRIDGGTFTASTVELRRTQSYPALRTTTDVNQNGLYVTGGTVNITTLNAGTSNSSVSARIDGGDVLISGNANIGGTSNTRYSILQVKGGTFTSTDPTNGVVLGFSTTTGNNAEFYLTGGTSTVEKITMGTSALVTAGSGTVYLNGGALYLGSGGVEKRAAGTYAANVSLIAGTLGAKANWATGVNLSTGAETANNAFIKAADATDAPFNITLSGIISGSSGFTKTGGGTLLLTGNNIYDSSFGTGTIISAGTLQVGNGGTSGSLGTGPVTNDARLEFQRSDALTVADVISGTGSVAQSGTGTLTLAAANLYAGGTTISAGTLSLANSSDSATGSGAVNVQSNGVLGGSGAAAGPVTVAAGGAVAPGAGVGTISAGSLTLAAGSNLYFEFNSTPSNDLIAVAGTLTLNGGAVRLRQENSANPWSALAKYYLIKYGTLAGTGISALSVANPVSGVIYTFGTETVGGEQFITLTLSSAGTPNTWNVDGSGSWDTAANWSTGIPGGIGNPVNFLGAISAARTITLDSARTAGSLTFDNGNPYILAGSVLAFNNGAPAAAATVQSGSHTINSNVSLPGAGLNATVSLADASLTFGGTVSGSGALRHQGPGTLRLTGNNPWDGGTTLAGNGIIEISQGAALGTAGLAWTGAGTLRPLAPLTLGNALSVDAGINGTIDTAGVDLTASGVISGAGGLVKTGAGVLTLTNTNSWAGGTAFRGGLISFAAPAQLGGGDLVFDGGGLRWGAGNATDISGGITLFLAGGATFDTGSNNLTLASVVGGGGPGSLTKTGSGKLTLAAANSYTGRTLVLGGALALPAAENLGPAPLTPVTQQLTLDGGALVIENSFDLPVTTGVAVGSASGKITVPVDLTLGIPGGIADRDALPGVLDLEGSGTVNFTGNSSYSGGGTFKGLTVNANATNAFGTGAVMLDGTTVNCAGNVFLPNGFIVNSTAAINLSNANPGSTLTGSLLGSGTLTMTATGNRSNISGDWTGFTGDLILTGDGEWRITGFNETLSNARVRIDGTTQLVLAVNPSAGVPRVIRIGQLTGTGLLGGQPVPGRSVRWTVGGLGTDSTFEGVIKDNMSQPNGVGNAASDFTKEGIGTLTLTGVSTYTGSTTVSNGTLLVNGDNTAATGALAVTGGTLGGTGIVGGAVTVEAAGFLAPGVSIGTLTTGTAFIEGTLLTEYDNSNANRIDRLSINGDLILGTASQLVLEADGAWPAGAPRVIASWTGSLSGTFATVIGLPAGYEVNYAFNDGVSSNNIAIVPGFSSPAYTAWLTANSLTGSAAAASADPDDDGIINLMEFALDGNPGLAADSGKSRIAIVTAGADQALTLTIPVRAGAVFSGATAQTAGIDGVIYTIEGSDDLSGWSTMVISEVTPAASAGLPALSTGWTYRTFRSPDPVSADNRDYLRVKVAPGS
jgi:autotransporter-associated beta strand protein